MMLQKKQKLTTLAIIISLCLVGGIVYFYKSKPSYPNIIWISLDTQRAQSLDLYGYPKPTSPFLKKFGEENIVFNKTYVQGTVTNLSHFSMLTGTYPLKHGILSIDPALRLPSDIKLVSEILQKKGYQTLLSGSLRGNPYLNPEVGLGRGFDKILIDDPIRFDWSMKKTLDEIKQMYKKGKPSFSFIHTTMVHVPYFPTKDCYAPYAVPFKSKIVWDRETVLQNMGSEITKVNLDNPIDIFLMEAYLSKVDPTNPKEMQMLEALYNGSIRCQDQQLEKFLNQIPDLKNTVIIITADHGESLGEHGLIQHGNLYQTDIWVPLIIQLPKYKKLRIQAPIRSIDILPSLLDYLDFAIPSQIDGKSFMTLLHSPAQQKHYDYAFSQRGDKYAVIKDQWKFISMNGRESLFDLENDPKELNNVSDKNPEITFELKNHLLNYQMKKD